MDTQLFLKSKVATIGLVIVFAAVAFITVELYWQKREVDSEVKRLQDQANALNNDNQQLSELIKYLDTPEYKEREAREKLNLKREGEEVVVLPENSGAEVASATIDIPNHKKWFNYFFRPE